MIRVKICGITRVQDARAAIAAGAHAIGFVFWPGSRRYVTPETAAEISDVLPGAVASVGVFVNEKRSEIERIRRQVGLSAVQLHGDEPPTFAHSLGFPVIKAFRGPTSIAQARRYRVAAWLLDGAARGAYGGTGTLPDHISADAFAGDARFILSGGLDPDNVAERCRRFRPAAVDVASGVESAPGIKDAVLMRRFIQAVETVALAPSATARQPERTGSGANEFVI